MKQKTNVEKKELSHRDEILLGELGLITKKEVAQLLQVHTSSIDRYVKEGRLPVKKQEVQRNAYTLICLQRK